MKLEEVKAQLAAAKQEEHAKEQLRLRAVEIQIIQLLADMGVMAVDGWDVQSNFPNDESVYVRHPDLPHRLLVQLSHDYYPVPLCAHIEGEHPELWYHIPNIVEVVEFMAKARPDTSYKRTSQLICPVMSPGEHECRCQEDECAWWSAHFHKCARAVLPSNGNR